MFKVGDRLYIQHKNTTATVVTLEDWMKCYKICYKVGMSDSSHVYLKWDENEMHITASSRELLEARVLTPLELAML